MSNRYAEPGWRLRAMHDPTGRRGLWTRESGDSLEVCAGREGDDNYIQLKVGQTLTRDDLKELNSCFSKLSYYLQSLVGNGKLDAYYDTSDPSPRLMKVFPSGHLK